MPRLAAVGRGEDSFVRGREKARLVVADDLVDADGKAGRRRLLPFDAVLADEEALLRAGYELHVRVVGHAQREYLWDGGRRDLRPGGAGVVGAIDTARRAAEGHGGVDPLFGHRIGGDGGDGQVAQPVAGARELPAAVFADVDAVALHAEDDAIRPLAVEGDVVDDETLVRNHVPRLAVVFTAVQTGYGTGVERVLPAGIDFDVVDAAVVETVAVAGPVLAAVPRVVDPAARRDPQVVGIVGGDSDREHVGVEHHPTVDQLPRLAAVVRARALAPCPDVDAVVGAGIEGQRLDVDLVGDLRPRPAAVGRPVDAGEAADDDEAGVVRVDGDGADGKIAQLFVAHGPVHAAVVRHGHDSAAPQTPAGSPEPSFTVDDEIVDDVAGERHAAARIAPRLRPVVRDVDLTAARAKVQPVRL